MQDDLGIFADSGMEDDAGIFKEPMDDDLGIYKSQEPEPRQKGPGYFGELQRPDGGVSTELSIGVELGGQETEIPSLTPNQNAENVERLLQLQQGGDIPPEIIDNSVAHARGRMEAGQSPFAQPEIEPQDDFDRINREIDLKEAEIDAKEAEVEKQNAIGRLREGYKLLSAFDEPDQLLKSLDPAVEVNKTDAMLQELQGNRQALDTDIDALEAWLAVNKPKATRMREHMDVQSKEEKLKSHREALPELDKIIASRSGAIDMFRQSGRAEEDIRAEMTARGEPWVQPDLVFTGAFGAGTRLAMAAGKTAGKAVGHGFATALPAAVTEFGIGTAAEVMEAKDHPIAALFISLGTGILSAKFLEPKATNQLLALGRKLYKKYPDIAKKSNLPAELIEKWKAEVPDAEGLAQKAGEAGQEVGVKGKSKTEVRLRRDASERLGAEPGEVKPESTVHINNTLTDQNAGVRDTLIKAAKELDLNVVPVRDKARDIIQDLKAAKGVEGAKKYLLDHGITHMVDRPKADPREVGAMADILGDKVLDDAADVAAKKTKVGDLRTGEVIGAEEYVKRVAKPKGPSQPKPSKITTLRGAIRRMGGIDWGIFKGELRDTPTAVKYLSKKSGTPIDLAEESLKRDGWLRPDEDLKELLRSDPGALRRNKVTGEVGAEKLEAHKTAQEKRFEKEMAHELEAPPEGKYVTMKAEDLPEGREMVIDVPGPRGWDTYKIKNKDPFGITLVDGEELELGPLTLVQVRQADLGKKELARVAEGGYSKGYEIKEPSHGYRQLQLALKPKKQESGAFSVLSPAQKTRMAITGRLSGGSTKVRDAGDAASLLAHIRKYAQENLYSVTVDKNDNILEIHRYSKGLKSASQISPSEIVGPILRTKGAQKAYLVHNHPSGSLNLSGAGADPGDLKVAPVLEGMLRLKGIEAESVLIAGTKYRPFTSATPAEAAGTAIKGTLRNRSLPIKERVLQKLKKPVDPKIESPGMAEAVVQQRHPDKTGIMFLNSQNREIGFMPLPAGKPYREAAAEIIVNAEGINARGAIVVLKDPLPQGTNRKAFLFKLKGALAGDVQVLDIVADGKSLSKAGVLPAGPADRRAAFRALDSGAILASPAEMGGAALGAAGGGVDWSHFEQTGEVKIKPMGALKGAAYGAGGMFGARKTLQLSKKVGVWYTKHATRAWDKSAAAVKRKITNESLRNALGLDRDPKFKDELRTFQRKVETAQQESVELGKELRELAPTALEQKRLKQILEGGVTVSKKLSEKAEAVRAKFDKLRASLKAAKLMEYSRFDKLTRRQRADLRRRIDVEMPDHNASATKWHKYAEEIGARDIPTGLKGEEMKELALAQHKLNQGRLNDYYHHGSAKEYLPIYYDEHEGLSVSQRKALRTEIAALKKSILKADPDGRVELKEMATQLQELLAEKKSALARLGAKRAPSGFIEMQKTSDQINRLLANKAHEITRQDVEDLTSRLGKIAGRGWKSQRELRAGFRAMNEGYTHRRQDLPVDVQRMLGKIEAAPYLVAKGTAVQQMDVYKARLFKTIADNPEWVRTKVRGGAEIPANFRKVDDERFGSLAGKYVRKDVWEDLREVNEWRGAFVRDWDKLLSLWKMGKVVYNPATHARNFMNNTILAYYGDVLPGDPVYIRAANQLRKKGRYYQEAKEWGLYNNSFVKAELYQLRDSLDEIRDPRALKTWIRKGIAKPSELYQANEHFFKTVVYIKARQSGMDVDAAARKAEKFLFNYGDIPPWVKHAKRWGAPFLTFTYKALPLAAEMTVKKPWKTAAIIAAMYGMEEFARHSLGETKEEAAKERSLLPEWQRSKLGVVAGPYVHVKMPFQDKWGNNLYLDLAYILPYGDTGEKWGQSGLPFGKVLPSHPFFDLMYSWGLNRDPFTGKDIHTPELDQAFGETWAAYWTKHLDYAWKALAPPLAPGAHNFDKLKTGFQNSFMDKDVRDWADRPVQFSTAVMSTLMGIKLTPANEEKLKQYEMWHRRNLSRAVGTEIGKLRYKLRRKEIDQAEFKKRARKLLELKRTLLLERPKP